MNILLRSIRESSVLTEDGSVSDSDSRPAQSDPPDEEGERRTVEIVTRATVLLGLSVDRRHRE